MALTPPRLLASLSRLGRAAAPDNPPRAYLLAYSGGLDSTVLLHLLAQAGAPLRAVYVDHGLQPDSAAWGAHCRALCQRLEVVFTLHRVQAHPAPGESPEAAARRARYQALADILAADEALLTAHHQDDQAETVLLQLLRGAGPRGLAAMPAARPLGRGWHLRPLLAYPRADLLAYAQAHELHWVDDPSNACLDYDRNFLRHQLMPVLRQRWPAAGRTLGRAARACAEASELMAELAAQDLAAAGAGTDRLPLAGVRGLSLARRRNALFHWLRQRGARAPSAAQMAQIEAMLAAAGDAAPRLDWDGWSLRRYRDALYLLPAGACRPLSLALDWDGRVPLDLPGLGRLVMKPARGRGLRRECVAGGLRVTFRQGGERCRPVGMRHSRPLKKLLQEAGVPPWQRQRIPLLFIDGQLAAVVGYWVCEPFAVSDEQAQGCWPEVVARPPGAAIVD